ncbi:Protein of unknown function (plasmid) [Azospirillum lipoferum 4B]|uniref:Uncharacterized protein n=1 Tax=Azospirillum lipoferum (strain 4B) TaxID=862719 RepID=G7ZII5_AZOL4|nr:Protein of unknown function [Azospirillum lipoferum 4B]
MTLEHSPKTETSFGHPASEPGHGTPPSPPRPPRKPVTRGRLTVRIIIMLVVLGLLGAALYGFNTFRAKAIADFFANNKPPPTPVALAEATVQRPCRNTCPPSARCRRRVR